MLKKLLVVSTILSIFIFAFGCSDAEKVNLEEKNELKVGILQIVEHPALDEAREGFIKGLEDFAEKEGKKIDFDYQNAQNDQSNLQMMSKKLVNGKNDLILAIGTNAAIALANETQNIPILFTAVTDPLQANLADSLERPGGNVSGTIDLNPIDEQIPFMEKIVPNLKKLGIIYNAGEINSEVQVSLIKEKIKDSSIEEIVEASVATSSEVMQAAQSLVNRVDAIYIPTDNTVISAYSAVVQVAEENKKPLFTAESSMIRSGGIGTVSIEYFELGEQTSDMAKRIFAGENIEEMSIEKQKNPKIIINRAGAERVGITLPEEIIAKAGKFIE